MIVTTSNDETVELVERAWDLARSLQINYRKRNKSTVKALVEEAGAAFVVNAHRGLSFYESSKEVFFHPNMAFLRIQELKRSGRDSFIEACGLEAGMTLFDGTLGLASDALVAAYVVGETGKVMGTERSMPLYALTSYGLKFYQEQHPQWEPLIRRMEIWNGDNLEYLRGLADDSIDVVYFDFMFEETVTRSAGIQVIKSVTVGDVLTADHVKEAVRVARRRVVAKSGYSGTSLQELGFEVRKNHKRRNFYFGVIDIHAT